VHRICGQIGGQLAAAGENPLNLRGFHELPVFWAAIQTLDFAIENYHGFVKA